MKVFLLIFISIILVTSVSLSINHPSFGYGGGGGGGGGGSGSTGDSRVCGDKLCSEIPGGREAWESRTNTKQVEGESSNTEKVSSLSNSPRKQMQNGIAAKDVVCKSGLALMIRTSGDAVCVKPLTAEKLIERGWGLIPEESSIDSFEKCAAAGNPVMESYPRQCRTPEGKHFVEEINNNSNENDVLETLKPLQNCSLVPGEEIACPADFVCYEDISGGLGPPGTLIPIESIGGDKLCHKECVTDKDCPSNAPFCKLTKIIYEDMLSAFYLCFSLDETPKTISSKNCSGSAGCFTGYITRIVDGDTIYTATLKIRLSLTNTPEKNQEGYNEATEFTEKLCPVGSEILVDQDDLQKVDQYGRVLAKVFCGDMVLNSELLKNGHANILTQYCPTSEFSGEAWAKRYGCAYEEPPKTTTPSTQTQQPSCDPSYPDFCIPSPPPDLDCKDIPQKRFTVLQPDPHRFDGDKDGIGCES